MEGKDVSETVHTGNCGNKGWLQLLDCIACPRALAASQDPFFYRPIASLRPGGGCISLILRQCKAFCQPHDSGGLGAL